MGAKKKLIFHYFEIVGENFKRKFAHNIRFRFKSIKIINKIFEIIFIKFILTEKNKFDSGICGLFRVCYVGDFDVDFDV